jgi:acylphosphatase
MLCIVSGRVQGVGFRWSTKRKADSLAVKGYARNLPDKTVEILACGETKSVDGLVKWLKEGGPMLSKIENMTGGETSADPLPNSFEIL